MARAINKLTDRTVKAATKAGRLSDGGGLFLRISPSGGRSWSFMHNKDGKRDEIGLGSYPAKSLASARDTAAALRTEVAEGRNPRDYLNPEKFEKHTFGSCVDVFLKTNATAWRSEKHSKQWRTTLETYCKPIMGKDVAEVTITDIRDLLSPIWVNKHETATRVRGRIERVIDYAMAEGWRETSNPAIWRGGLKALMPEIDKKRLKRRHFPAMHYNDVPDFIIRLRNHEALAARALEIVILTACRTGEVLGARWSEIDLDAALWTIPANRMKAGAEHVIPLTEPTQAILGQLFETRTSDLVFEGQKRGRPLSQMSMLMLLRRMKMTDVTVHGFRSSFRDWAGNETEFPREVAEACLAHEVGNAVERAYRRSRAIDKQRQLLSVWADYVTGTEHGNVVALHGS
ncbi:MAG: integrase arm-type DNA-binding domain-containing protein [Pseudomonadota bacterium]